MSDVTIYHNPKCGTSRNALALIRNAGIEPTIVRYLETPPTGKVMLDLFKRAGLSVREAMREKEAVFKELDLSRESLTDDDLLHAIEQHPILLNRPIVATSLGVKLCRPCEEVLDILPSPQQGAFNKENGDPVIDAKGKRVTA